MSYGRISEQEFSMVVLVEQGGIIHMVELISFLVGMAIGLMINRVYIR